MLRQTYISGLFELECTVSSSFPFLSSRLPYIFFPLVNEHNRLYCICIVQCIFLCCLHCIYFLIYLFRIPSIVEPDTNRQLLIKLRKYENGELITSKNSSDITMSTECLINEQQNCSITNEIPSTNYSEIIHTNGHDDSLCRPSSSSTTSNMTNLLSSFNNETVQKTTTSLSDQSVEK